MQRLVTFDVSRPFRSRPGQLFAQVLFGSFCAASMVGLRSLQAGAEHMVGQQANGFRAELTSQIQSEVWTARNEQGGGQGATS